MKKDSRLVLHYKAQRDLLAYYLKEQFKVSNVQLSKVLGVSSQAVSLQFPKRSINND